MIPFQPRCRQEEHPTNRQMASTLSLGKVEARHVNKGQPMFHPFKETIKEADKVDTKKLDPRLLDLPQFDEAQRWDGARLALGQRR